MTEVVIRLAEFERLKAREPEAQARFLRALQPTVVSICQRILGDRLVAEDLAQDVLIDFLFDAASRVERPETVVPYLRLMAARRALRQREKRARAEPLSSEIPNTSDTDPLSALTLARASDQVAHCLEELSPKARWVLKLRFDADLTQENIGQVVGGTKQYIGKVIRQSLGVLRRCLELRGVSPLGGSA